MSALLSLRTCPYWKSIEVSSLAISLKNSGRAGRLDHGLVDLLSRKRAEKFF